MIAGGFLLRRILLDVERQRAVGGIRLLHPEECPAKISCAR
jgi:hypothetical protein